MALDTSQIFEWIGQLVLYGGGSVAIAFAAFRAFSESWLQSKFDKSLEAFRHENAKELQGFRAKIDGKLNATIRIQEREFAALSECHEKMNKAFGVAHDFVSPVQSYGDIASMSAEAKLEYLRQFDLLDFQRNEIVDSSDPNRTFFQYLKLLKMQKAQQGQAEFNNAIYRNEIYFDNSVSSDFKSVSETLRKAIVRKKVFDETDFEKAVSAWDTITGECSKEIERITDHIRSHLRAS